MFEHMRNFAVLYQKISTWLKKDGKFFKHIFVHKSAPYLFKVKDKNDWMSQYFFSGGMMPSIDLPLYFQSSLKIEQQWLWDGTHYAKTAREWLNNTDKNKAEIINIFKTVMGRTMHNFGFKDGEYFLWPVRNFGIMTKVKSGWLLTIFFQNET